MHSTLSNRITLALFLTLLLLLGTFTFGNLKPAAIFFANDQATDLIVARLASQGDVPLLGPPSHTGGRHLGPVYYWFVFAGAKIADFNIPWAIGFYSVSKLAALSVLLLFCLALSQPRVRPAVLLGAFYLFSSIPLIQLVRTQWHSHYLIIPSLLVVLTGTLVILRGVVWLPAALIAMTLLGLSHLSAGPAVIAFTLILLLFCLSGDRRRQTFSVLKSGQFFLSLLVACLLISYPVIFELNYPSNFSELFHTHTAESVKRAGPVEALLTCWRFLAHITVAPESEFKKSWPAILLTVCMFFVVLHAIRNSTSRERWFLTYLCAPLICTTVLLIFFKTPLYKHYFNSSIAVPLVLFLYVVAHAALLALNKKYSWINRLPAILMLAIIAVLTPFRILNGWQFLKDPVEHDFHSLEHVEEIARLIQQDAGSEKPLVWARLSAKLARNGYFYLLNDVQSEAEYREFFPELNFLSQTPMAERKLAYLVSCPRPYSFTRADLLKPFLSDWQEAGELITVNSNSTSGCLIIRMQRKT